MIWPPPRLQRPTTLQVAVFIDLARRCKSCWVSTYLFFRMKIITTTAEDHEQEKMATQKKADTTAKRRKELTQKCTQATKAAEQVARQSEMQDHAPSTGDAVSFFSCVFCIVYNSNDTRILHRHIYKRDRQPSKLCTGRKYQTTSSPLAVL